MSYILEALKKSQQERQIGHVPDISQIQDAPLTRPAPRWPRWLLAALLVNVVMLVALAWRTWETRRVAVVSEPAVAVAPSAPSPTVNPVPAPRIETPVETTGAPTVAAPPPEAASPEPAAPPVTEAAPPPMTQPAIQVPATVQEPEAELLPPIESAPPIAEAVPELQPELPPRWQDLPLEERTGLPAPRIDVHVFDREPERRFVLIDLRKYQVGDTLSEGATLDAIIADGIVLSYGGRKYRVDRP